MTTSSNSTPSQTTQTMPTPDVPKIDPTSATDSQFDDLGYEVSSSTKKTKEENEDSTVVTPPTEAKKEETPPAKTEPAVTGYEKPVEAKKEETPPAKTEEVPPKKEEVPPADEAEKLKKEISDAVKTLGDGYDHEGITKFALDNKLTTEQLKAYANFSKAQDEKALKEHNERVIKQRQEWYEEIKADKEFVGEKGDQFDASLHKINQLLDKNMPETKKMLTEKKGMLPPYLMKDLLRLHKALNPTTKFEGGEPPGSQEEDKHYLDEIYD